MAEGVHGTSVLLRMEGRAGFKTVDDEENDTEMGFSGPVDCLRSVPAERAFGLETKILGNSI